jgi:hypothetical protein
MAARKINVPVGGTWSVGVNATYNYRDETFVYLRSDDPELSDWEGSYVRTWSGYGYAGWAVRLSDGKGKVLAKQGAQPSFLRHIENVPVPRLKN